MNPAQDNPRIFVPPPLLIAATLLAGLALQGKLRHWPEPGALVAMASLVLVLVGFALIGGALGLFWKAGTRPEPWAAASAIVRGGPYRFTRNPMYLGMLAVYAGVALYFLSWVAGAMLVPLFAIMDRIVIPREETYLTRRFGREYEAFRMRVRRWL